VTPDDGFPASVQEAVMSASHLRVATDDVLDALAVILGVLFRRTLPPTG
jgi:hypothetical protein